MSDGTDGTTSAARLGGQLRRRRKELGETQQVIGGWFCVNQSTIARWERGEPIPRDRLERLASFLGRPLEEIVHAWFECGTSLDAALEQRHENPSVAGDLVGDLEDFLGLHPGTLRWFAGEDAHPDHVAESIRRQSFGDTEALIGALRSVEALGLGVRVWNGRVCLADGTEFDQWWLELYAEPIETISE